MGLQPFESRRKQAPAFDLDLSGHIPADIVGGRPSDHSAILKPGKGGGLGIGVTTNVIVNRQSPS